MAQTYLDSPLDSPPMTDSGDSSSQQVNRNILSNGTKIHFRNAAEWDVIRTVDISIALHTQLYPLVITKWMDEMELSAQLSRSRNDIISSSRSRQSFIVAYELQSPRRAFGEYPAEMLHSQRKADQLREEDAGYLIGIQPLQDGGDPITNSFEVKGDNSAKYTRHREEWKAERKEYLTANTWELKEIAVLPSYRNKGIGSHLVRLWLKKVDAANGSAFVSATSKSKSFFERFGFETRKISTFDLGRLSEPFVVNQMTRSARGEPTDTKPIESKSWWSKWIPITGAIEM